jgi:serine/threonine protein kinase
MTSEPTPGADSPAHGEQPRYRRDSLIAVGGMGEVWSATDTLLEREVALKVLKREHADDPVFRARFAAEARHAASLSHPHVAAVLDYGELAADDTEGGPVPYLVMELVRGQPLSALLADGKPLAPEVAADLIAQAAEGIEAAHALGIVHRDVKPGNLLVTPEGQVKVTDFGIARAADTVPLTVTGHLVGTPHYLSPEQAEGKGSSPASDVYSLGIVLFECLAGHKPFAGESAVATALMQVREPLPPLPDSVPRHLQDITRRATAKDPAERFASAADLAGALRGELADVRTSVLPTSPGDAAPTTIAPVVGASPRATNAPGPRRGLLLGALGVLALLAVAVTAGVLLSGNDDPAPTARAGSRDPSSGTSPRSSATGAGSTGSPASSDTVTVDPAAYVGLPEGEAVKKLRDAGLEPVVEKKPNPGDEPEGTVASVDPTGQVPRGSEVTVAVWDKAPKEPKAPKPEHGGGPGKDKGGKDKGHDKGRG